MKKFSILLLLIFTLAFPAICLAQEKSENSTTTKYFDIELIRDGQSAWNKAVTYTVHVTPKIDSTRTQILWDAPFSVEINPRHKEFVDMYRGETYTFKANVKAKRPGSYEITVNLIAWQHDTNYTNSLSDIVTFDNDLLVVPRESNYIYSLIGKYLIIAVASGLTIWGIVVYGKNGIKALKKWLTPPT